MRAAMESIAFTVKANLSTLTEVAGSGDEVLHAAGGMTSSPVLMQILADVIDAPVQCSSHTEATARGAAAAGGVAARLFDSLPEAIYHCDDPPVLYEPNPSAVAEYEFHYRRWLEMAQSLHNLH